jgi:mTERF domain-containing protein
MLRLRRSILAHLLSSPATSPASSLHRFLSAAAPRIPLNPSFAIEDYLVETCGLTRAQALKACGRISHIKSTAAPDAVLAFLAGLGLSRAAVVAKDPRLLCAKVEKTLASNAAGLRGLGLSNSEVARLVSLSPSGFRIASIVSKVQYYLPIFFLD